MSGGDAGKPTAQSPLMQGAVSMLLMVGLGLACAACAVGGWMLLAARHGVPYRDVSARPAQSPLRAPGALVDQVLSGDAAAIALLGVMLLIFTPVARVVLSLALFALAHDWLYVMVSAIVLALLAVGLVVGV